MGCDIHAVLEVKLKKRWEHACQLNINRDYEMFGKLVKDHPRDGSQNGIACARGFPDDVNPLTKILLTNDDYHTHSWVRWTEIMKKIPDFVDYLCKDEKTMFYEGIDYIDEDWHMIGISKLPKRIVFAFDN